MKEQILTLKNGNKVGLLSLGDESSNEVVFYCHGFPGCRLEAKVVDNSAKRCHLKILALDRPGYGNSSYAPARTIADFPNLLHEIVQQLNINSFSLLAVSGGTPYALISAAKLPQYLKKVIIVSGVSPVVIPNSHTRINPTVFKGMNFINKNLLKLGVKAPFVAKLFVAVVSSMWRKSACFMALWLKTFMSKSDRRILSKKDNSNSIVAIFNEAIKQGYKGICHDFQLLCSDWGACLSEISIPVTIWHGDSDCYVPFSMGEYNANQIKNAFLKPIPNEGHLMIIKILPEILKEFR